MSSPMKTIATTLTIAALAAAPITLTATAAHAGTDKVNICHATSAANGHYTLITADKSSVAGGHGDAAHQEGRDIIPAFSWVENKTRHYFEGQNLDKLSILEAGCKVPTQPEPAAPNPPTYIPASCARPHLPHGEVVIPKDLGEGVAGASSAFDPTAPNWSVTYALTEGRAWPAGITGTYSGRIVPITEDEFWVTDSKTGKGECVLPETGAGDLLLPAGLALGAIAAGVAIRRRSAAA